MGESNGIRESDYRIGVFREKEREGMEKERGDKEGGRMGRRRVME